MELVSGRAYRAYVNGYDEMVKSQLIVSDEKLVIFSNGLIYAMTRKFKTDRRFFSSLSEYNKSQTTGIIAGLSDCYYSEPFALSTLLLNLAEDQTNYTPEELLELFTMLKALYSL